jgi:hypothetical protein
MKTRLVLSMLVAALAAIPSISQANDVQWETLRVYTLVGGRTVAVAVPAEWQGPGETEVVRTALRFRDLSDAEVAIPVAALERAATEKRLFRPDLTEKIAQADARKRN